MTTAKPTLATRCPHCLTKLAGTCKPHCEGGYRKDGAKDVPCGWVVCGTCHSVNDPKRGSHACEKKFGHPDCMSDPKKK